MQRTMFRRIIIVLLATLAVVVCLPVMAQVHLSKSTKAAHDIFLEGYARTNSKCETIAPPEIYLDQPPEHGIVCLKRADVWLRATVEGGLTQCLRRKVRGIHVIYLPRGGYTGADRVRYTVQFPHTQHTVEVDLNVVPDYSASRTAVPADISAPLGEGMQVSGAIPACTALVS